MGSDIDGEAVNDFSGTSVSLSSDGSVVAIGARLNDGNGDCSGHVRVYHYNETTEGWNQMGSDIDGEAVNDLLHSSVSLSSDGSVVAIGAPSSLFGGGFSGNVRVYHYN